MQMRDSHMHFHVRTSVNTQTIQKLMDLVNFGAQYLGFLVFLSKRLFEYPYCTNYAYPYGFIL